MLLRVAVGGMLLLARAAARCYDEVRVTLLLPCPV